MNSEIGRYIKYSFIIPAYNAERVIKRCVKSIQKIQVRNLEIIVVNDGSVDNTKEYVQLLIKNDARIRLINIDNGGVSNARNIGVRNAVGKYILFCDADDFYFAKNFMLLDQLLDKNEIDVLHFGYCKNYRIIKFFSRYSFNTNIIYKNADLNKEEFWENVIGGNDCLNVWHMVVKREIIKDINFDTNLKYGEDTLFVFNAMIQSESICFTDLSVYNYDVNTSGAIGNIELKKLIKKIKDIIESYQRQYFLLNEKNILFNKEFIDKRCFGMILGDVKKIYYSSKDINNAKKNIYMLSEQINNDYINEKIKIWYLSQNKLDYYIGHFIFNTKNFIKRTLLSR